MSIPKNLRTLKTNFEEADGLGKRPIFVNGGEANTYGVSNPSKPTPILSCDCEYELQNFVKFSKVEA